MTTTAATATADVRAYQNFIAGQWTPSDSGRTYPVYNPAHKDRLLGHFQLSNPEDALRAVAAAADAAPTWADTPAPVRAQVLFRALDIMGRRSEEIARAITEEEGKPLADARGEVKRAMNIIEYAAGEGRRMFGYTTPSELPNTVAYTMRRPLGVVGIITPWNFPIAIPAWKMAPALICGNAIVFKPASGTPLCAVKLTEVFAEAGLPPGVLNLITGPGGSVGNAPGGIPGCGRHFLHRQHGDWHRTLHPRRRAAQKGAGRNGRQKRRHPAGRRRPGQGPGRHRAGRLRLHRTALHRHQPGSSLRTASMTEFMEQLIDRTSRLTIGDGMDETIDVSPLSSASQQRTVAEYIAAGKDRRRHPGLRRPHPGRRHLRRRLVH